MTRQRISVCFWATLAVALCFLALQPGPAIGAACAGRWAMASWYGVESCVRRPPHCRTADGSIFTGNALTAAMPSRSHLGERWRVSYRGRSVVVLVNDYGPAAALHRGIDLSRAAARAIGFDGVHSVCLERLQ